MRDINWYVETAKSKNNLKSGNQLAKEIGITSASYHRLTTGQSYPSDETMVKFAELSGVDPVIALADLNVWRAPTPKVLSVYQKMDKLLSRAAMLSLALIMSMTVTKGAYSANLHENINMLNSKHSNNANIYYHIYQKAEVDSILKCDFC